MLQQKIDHISQVVKELEGLKTEEKIHGISKIYGQGIVLSLTSDLSEALSNYYAKNQNTSFKETTIDELIDILRLDIEENKLALEEQNKK